MTHPESAPVVIIGGGIIGCSTLYHLAHKGVPAVLLERKQIASGTTWHAAGIVGQLRESAAQTDGQVAPWQGETDIFITPGYRFKAVDTLMTNFHLPRSTLFMLVSAFAGLDRMRAAYQHAIQTGYRFYSYGDSSLLHKVDPT